MFESNLKYIENNKIPLWVLGLIFIVTYIFTATNSYADINCHSRPSNAYNTKAQLNFNRYSVNQPIHVRTTVQEISCDRITDQDIGKNIVIKITSSANKPTTENDIFSGNLTGVAVMLAARETYPRDNQRGSKLCTTNNYNMGAVCKIEAPTKNKHNQYYTQTYTYTNLIYIVKLANIYDTGMLVPPTFDGTYHLAENNTGGSHPINLDLNFNYLIEILTGSCELNTKRIDFDLGKQDYKDFNGIGAIGLGQTQQIALTCDPRTQYSLQIDGNAEPGHSGVIKLTPEPGADLTHEQWTHG
ncbi:hypothetical protein [Yersinia hibernica]|uniref:Uncharacterized protein n=1 Tax=Yersinia enterocolitica LC20 TaxID=1443113 RepID=A0A7U4K2D8_YEREN|nr:hypothetical protein [Yersinia hibernica]AHM75297.1 hypothetical protein LC20_04044 [Yersinia hibernica]